MKITITETTLVEKEIETPLYCKEKGTLPTYYFIEDEKWTHKVYLSPSGYMSYMRIESVSMASEVYNKTIACSREEFEEQRAKFLSMINAEELV
jgi:hypothetical protein